MTPAARRAADRKQMEQAVRTLCIRIRLTLRFQPWPGPGVRKLIKEV